MASIRQRNGRWQARVIRQGYPDQTQTFDSKSAAERWARSVEASIDRGQFVDFTEAHRTTLGELIERYLREVTPTMKSATDDTIRLRAIMRRPIAKWSVAKLSAARVAAFRDERLQQVSSGTVIRELAYLSAIMNHARREWGINVDNPVSRVRKPPSPPGRERVLTNAEQDRLLNSLQPTGRRNPWTLPLVELALETAMRRGELLALRWEDVSLVRCTATLHETKNGEGRTVPLSTKAVAVLEALPRSITGQVFPVTAFAACAAFDKAIVRAGISDLRFHDLRHTAITRMASKLPNVIELAAVSGHKSLRMLARYYHPRPEDLARKLG